MNKRIRPLAPNLTLFRKCLYSFLILFFLLGVWLLDLNFYLIFEKVHWILFRKSIHFLFRRIGCFAFSGVLISQFTFLFHLEDHLYCFMEGGSYGASNPVRGDVDAGESSNLVGSSRGSGWTSFDLAVLAEEGEEINQPIPAEQEPAPRAGFQSLPWEEALNLPPEEPAPPCLVEHLKKELIVLFNIGYHRTRRKAFVEKAIEPLHIEDSSVGFLKALLERVDVLQREHLNNGFPSRFPFESKSDKDRLYSILREYAAGECTH